MAKHVKVAAPVWDSTANKPPFPDFCAQFESFVRYQEDGAALLQLFSHATGRPRVAPGTARACAGLELTEAEYKTYIRLSAPDGGKRDITSYKDLTPEERVLDYQLHSILNASVSGKRRNTITQVQIPSWVQAWAALHYELGATNAKRRMEVLNKLTHLQFSSDVAEFKSTCTALVTEVYQAEITLEDIIMNSVLMAIRDPDAQTLKLVMAETLEKKGKTDLDVIDFIDKTCTTLEVSGMAKPRQTHAWKASHAPKKAPKKKGVNFSGSALPSDFCKRCGRQGHIKSECFAKKHKHGHRLDDSSSDEELGSTRVGIARIANMDPR